MIGILLIKGLINFFVNFNAAFVPFLPNTLTTAFRASFVPALRVADLPRVLAALPPPTLPPTTDRARPTEKTVFNTLLRVLFASARKSFYKDYQIVLVRPHQTYHQLIVLIHRKFHILYQ